MHLRLSSSWSVAFDQVVPTRRRTHSLVGRHALKPPAPPPPPPPPAPRAPRDAGPYSGKDTIDYSGWNGWRADKDWTMVLTLTQPSTDWVSMYAAFFSFGNETLHSRRIVKRNICIATATHS